MSRADQRAFELRLGWAIAHVTAGLVFLAAATGIQVAAIF